MPNLSRRPDVLLAQDKTAGTRAITYPDGYDEAPGTAAQHPDLLKHYVARPPWRVAGVDFGVGLLKNRPRTDWRNLSHPGLALGNGIVRGDNLQGFVFDSIDFSTGPGAQIMLVNCSGTSITNCKFMGPSYPALSTSVIYQDDSSSDLTVKYCEIDGSSVGGPENQAALIIAGGGKIVVQYNWLRNYCQQILSISKTSDVDYRFNLLGQCRIADGAHHNVLQWTSDSASSSALVAFNTMVQLLPTGGEGFQFYSNGSGTILSPSLTNNTIVCRGTRLMSYLVHGNTRGTTPSDGSPTCSDNYFDRTGAFGGAFYPHSLNNWTVRNNVDMLTGLPVT